MAGRRVWLSPKRRERRGDGGFSDTPGAEPGSRETVFYSLSYLFLTCTCCLGQGGERLARGPYKACKVIWRGPAKAVTDRTQSSLNLWQAHF